MTVLVDPGRRGRAPYAAIDLGTNNCRMLVARPAGGGFEVVDAFSRVVRLGEGMSESEYLREEAIDRTLAALRVCGRKMQRHKVLRARGVATEACRRARNGSAFLQSAEAAAGIALEAIGPREEAALALSGCRSLLTPECDRGLLVDIGGGSTEVVWFRVAARPDSAAEILASLSLPLGVVGLTEQSGADASLAAFERVQDEIAVRLQAFDGAHGIGRAIERGRVQALGTSGTVTTLAGLSLGLANYDRSRVDGAQLSCGEIERISRRLATMTVAKRAQLPCVGAARADLLLSGCAILSAICRVWPVGRWVVADRGLREGILLELMAADGLVAA